MNDPVCDILVILREKAQELLCSTTLSISEIAAATGYDSVYNFYKLFKKYNNSTPNEFRKKFR